MAYEGLVVTLPRTLNVESGAVRSMPRMSGGFGLLGGPVGVVLLQMTVRQPVVVGGGGIAEYRLYCLFVYRITCQEVRHGLELSGLR